MKRALIVAVVVLAFAIPAFAQSTCTLTYLTESLPGFVVGQPANFQLEACCGTEPYHFTIVGGTLPAGLHMNPNGKITGVPREEADVTVFVQLSDAAGCTLTQAFAVRTTP